MLAFPLEDKELASQFFLKMEATCFSETHYVET
jgi:hypothetical protein